MIDKNLVVTSSNIYQIGKNDVRVSASPEYNKSEIIKADKALEIADSLGLDLVVINPNEKPMIVKIIEEHLDLIEEYRKGRNVFDFFVGQVMKQTRGQANPSLTAKIIKEEIDKR